MCSLRRFSLLIALVSGCGETTIPNLDGALDGGADAGAEACDTPGATEDVACGRCGSTERFCTAAGFWAYGVCGGEGECAAGEERSGTCSTCGTQLERCSDACAWEPIGVCDAVCTPGMRTRTSDGCPAGQTREVLCTDACEYEPAGDCRDDTCSSPGAVEDVPCGNCGTQQRFCATDGTWSYGTCGAEGECAPGTSMPQPCGNCGEDTARCTTACAWQLSGTCVGEGECAPGASTRSSAGCPAGESRELTCNASCSYDAGMCESMECSPGATTTVPCGMCGTRMRSCDSSGMWIDGACTGEGACMPGTSGTQACGNCGTQATLCDTTCAWVPSGTCSGGGTCAAGSVSSCTTSCGSTGTQTCSATCTPGVCMSPAETCNGRDDDCDGMTDEGCTGCGTCAGTTPVTAGGGRYTVTLAPNVRTGTCGGSGAEALLSLSLSTTSDVFVSTHGASLDTVVYLRSCNCDGPEVGCNDDADGRTTSALRATNLAPGNYIIAVDTDGATSGTVGVDVYVTAPASQGDRCGNPLPIAAGASRLMGSTCSRAADYDLTNDTGTCTVAAAGDAAESVYYFYLPTSRTVTINGCRTGNDYDGTLYIRSVCNGATLAQQAACNDDNCASGLTTCERYRPSLTATLPAGLYYLFVDGYVHTGFPPACTACGNFDLGLSGL